MRLLFVWASAVVPVIAAGEAFTLARVTGNAVNLRAAPSVGAPALGKVSEDEHLVVCGTTGDWVRVYLPKRLPVFVSKDDIARAGEDAFVERPAAVRMEPDRAFAEVGKIPPGTNVKLIRQYGVWWAIEPPLSLTAYVNSQYVKGVKALSAPEAESVLGGRGGAVGRDRAAAGSSGETPVETCARGAASGECAPAGGGAAGKRAPRFGGSGGGGRR